VIHGQTLKRVKAEGSERVLTRSVERDCDVSDLQGDSITSSCFVVAACVVALSWKHGVTLADVDVPEIGNVDFVLGGVLIGGDDLDIVLCGILRQVVPLYHLASRLIARQDTRQRTRRA